MKKQAHGLQKIKLKTLATNKDIKAAVAQVIQYCPELGSEFACITNGHVYIIFRAFTRGTSVYNGNAIVISKATKGVKRLN